MLWPCVTALLLSSAPVVFEQNAGQRAAPVKLTAHASGATAFLTDEGVVISLERGRARTAFRIALPHAPRINPEPLEPLAQRTNFFVGDRSRWRSGVRNFAGARYREVAPGVDLELHGESGALELDLRLAPGAPLDAVRLAFTGARVAEVRPGALVLDVAGERVELGAPVARQGDRSIECRYRRHGDEIGFELAAFDRRRELLIDPVIATWSGFVGGSVDDIAYGAAVASNGEVVTIGSTSSSDFPFALGVKMYAGGQDAFITRVDPLTGAVKWSTLLGGSLDDDGAAVAIEAGGAGAIVATGSTLSANFPSTVPARPYDGGMYSDAWIARLPPTGDALLFSTTFGGTNIEEGTAIAVDATSIWVGGNSRSSSIAGGTPPAWLNNKGNQDGFVAQFQTDAGLTFFTWFGGEALDTINTLKLDGAGNLYLGGQTASKTQLPQLHPLQDAGNGNDGYLAIIDPSSPPQLLFASFLGGPSNDTVNSLALAPSGDIYVGGQAYSTSAWTAIPFTRLHPTTTGADGFVGRISAMGTSVKWLGVVGGGDVDQIYAVNSDSRGNLYFAGYTGPNTLKNVTPGAIQTQSAGKSDGVFGMVDPDGNQFVYLSFLGGAQGDQLRDVQMIDGGVVLVGDSASTDFPIAGAVTTLKGDGGTHDAIVTSVLFPPPLVTTFTPTQGPIDGGTRVDFSGDYFLPDASVTFAGALATVVQKVGQTGLSVVTPPGLPGPADVVVTNADGQQRVLAGAFTYVGALPPVARIDPPMQTVAPGAVSLDGSGSAGVAPLTFAWEETAGPTAVALGSGTMQSLTLQVPGDYSFRLSVTDGNGATASADATVTVTGNATPVPPFKPGCGCGSFDFPAALVVLALSFGRGRR